MTNEELVRAALEKVGGKSNVLTATNCMTRLRVRVKDDAKIDDEGLKAIEGVMGIVHDRTGYVSTALCWVVEKLCMSDILIVRIIAGYISTALFLPMVAMGMHHGLVALYSVQLESFGYVTLYPALAMAGAGQVGAAVAIYFKAKKCGNTRLKNVITGALPAGLLGIGEPLIYGVTLPMGKPFISAGLGAGFGGAFVMAMQVAATAWGPSGLLALFVMTAGPHGVAASVGCYAVGLVICYIMGFIVTNAMVSVEDVANA